MGLGYITRQALLKRMSLAEFKQKIAPRFPAMSTIGVLGIVFVAMALKAQVIVDNPSIVGSIFVPLVILYLINFVLSTLVGLKFFGRGDGIARDGTAPCPRRWRCPARHGCDVADLRPCGDCCATQLVQPRQFRRLVIPT